MKKQKLLKAKEGCRLSLYTGEIEYGFQDRMSTLHFYEAFPGSRLSLMDDNYEFAVATYSCSVDDRYIYTYSYQKEENWSTFRKDLHPDSYGQGDYIFREHVFFRVNLKKKDASDFTGEEDINQILSYECDITKVQKPEDYYQKEVQETVHALKQKQEPDSAGFLILSDSHYVVNGTWDTTAANIQALTDSCRENGITLDGILHLGDLTDGMVSRQVNRDYIEWTIKSLEKTGIPVYLCLGNHDMNYFGGNPEVFSKKEASEIYFRSEPANVCRNPECNYYYADFGRRKLRLFVLDSFDHTRKIRYGFDVGQMKWLKQKLFETPKDFKVLVVSHVPPLAKIHFWSDIIYHERRLVSILESFHKENGQILCYLHGHNHADAVFSELSFPIVAIGCAKCEYFEDKKPEGSYTPIRKPGTLTQELWDVLAVSPEKKTLDFIRFGAGKDRRVQV